MKNFLKVALLFASAAYACGTLYQKENPKTTLKFVGAADGKSFFTDSGSPRKVWDAARVFCQSMGMKLAEITSLSQWNALDTGFQNSECFWTGARDSLKLSQFEWSNSSRVIEASFAKYQRRTSSPLTCVCFRSRANKLSTLENWPCNGPSASLCEAGLKY